MSQTPARWAILGLGKIAHKFAADLLTVPDAQLFAVASTDQGRADEFAAQYGATHALGSYEALTTLPDVEAVYVATTHVHHYANTMMLLNAGIPVLCEKPFAMNAGQVQDMVNLARSKNVFLMEALWSRFMPGIQKALALVQDGAIGRVRTLTADFGFKADYQPEKRLFNKAEGGGSLLDIGIYPLFLSYLMLGMPTQIRAQATFGPTGADEQCGMVLTYEGGEMAVLNSTFVTKTDTLGTIFGEAGVVRIHGRFHETKGVTLERDGRQPETFTFDRDTHGYDYEAQHVTDCLREGRSESPLWSLTDSRNLMALLDGVRAESGIVYSGV